MKKKEIVQILLLYCFCFAIISASKRNTRESNHKSIHFPSFSGIEKSTPNRRTDIYTPWRLSKQKQTRNKLNRSYVTQQNVEPLRKRSNVNIGSLRKQASVNVDPSYRHDNQITKRSRNGRVSSYEHDLASDFFGISTEEPVVNLVDNKGPVGTATSDFVDPFNDMIEEPSLSQYAYKSQHDQEIDDRQLSFEGAQKPGTGASRHQEIGLQLGKMSTDEQQHVREALRVTDDDTEVDQTKARILSYNNRLSKKKQQEKLMNSSNPYAYLNLPATQSVDIKPMKPKSEREEASISSFSQHVGDNNMASDHEAKEDAPEGKSSEKSVEVDFTPPSADAETVPTSVVEVKESENNNDKESQDAKAVDELTTIVSNALPDGDKSTGKGDEDTAVSASANGKQDGESKQSESVSSALIKETKNSSKEINNETSSTLLHDSKQQETNTSVAGQKPAESTSPSSLNQYIDIKEPNLKFSIALNGTENQTDRYIEKLENVIKLVKGMRSSPAGKTPDNNSVLNTFVNQPTPTVKHEVENPPLSPSSTTTLFTPYTTNDAADMKNSAKSKSPTLDIGYVRKLLELHGVTWSWFFCI